MNRELRHPGNGTRYEDEPLLHSLGTTQDESARKPKIAVEPGIEERPAVDLHSHLAVAIPAGVRVGLQAQVGRVGVGADDAEAVGGLVLRL